MSRVSRRFFVRWHMALIFAGVVMSGLLASPLLLAIGVHGLALRYLLVTAVSYFVFFLFVRLWLAYVSRSRPLSYDSEMASVLDMPVPMGHAGDHLPSLHPGGGSFGGGGATAGFDNVSASQPIAPGAGGASGGSGHVGGSGGWFGLDLDDSFAVLLAFLILLALIGGVGVYLVYQAPAILGEAVFQLILATTLRRASPQQAGVGWSGSVLKATWIPFMLVLVMAGGFGWLAQRHCPLASKLVEVVFGCLLEP